MAKSDKRDNVIVITDPETRQDVEISEQAYNLVISMERKKIKQGGESYNPSQDADVATLSNLLRSWKQKATMLEQNEKHLRTLLQDRDEQISAQKKTIRKLQNALVMLKIDLEEQTNQSIHSYQQHATSSVQNAKKRKLPPLQMPHLLVGQQKGQTNNVHMVQRKRARVSRTEYKSVNSPLYLPGKGAKPSPARANAPRYSVEHFYSKEDIKKRQEREKKMNSQSLGNHAHVMMVKVEPSGAQRDSQSYVTLSKLRDFQRVTNSFQKGKRF